MKLNFTKMHGCGNDYIYFNCFEQEVADPEALSIRLSDRHFGIGGDGIVLICPSETADAKMRMFNADGSEGKMCGNATRCIGKYMYDHGMIDKPEMTLETLSGIKLLKMTAENGTIASVTVDMGKAILKPADIPVRYDGETAVSVPLEVDGVEYAVTCVSMGNPHCVVFVDADVNTLDLPKIGPSLSTMKNSPNASTRNLSALLMRTRCKCAFGNAAAAKHGRAALARARQRWQPSSTAIARRTRIS